MKELLILLSPFLWSVKNDIIRFNRSFYRKALFYAASSGVFLFLFTKLLGMGMTKLQGMSPDVFELLLMKGYSLIFAIIFFIQMVNGFVISLSTFFHARDLEILLTSPVDRSSLFFSRLAEVHGRTSWMLVIFGIPLLTAVGFLYHASVLYFVVAVLLFSLFSLIAVNAGSAFSLFVSRYFRAGGIRKVFLSLGVTMAVLLVMLLRMARPEQYVNPELFANLTLFITELKAPSFVLLPNRWLGEAIFVLLGKSPQGGAVMFIGLLALTAYVSTLVPLLVFKRCYYAGWGLLQEGGAAVSRKGPYAFREGESVISRAVRRCFFVFGRRCGTLMGKDFLYQVRDVSNLHQLAIVVSLVVIYLFSIASLPMNWMGYEAHLKYVISFFNLGLVLVILAALCSRVVYPAVVSESAFLWITRTSPVTLRRYVWAKFLFFIIPLLGVGQFLVIASSVLIGVERSLILLKAATTALLSFSLLGVSLFFATSAMRSAGSENLERGGRTGSTTFLLVSVFLIIASLALEVAPVFLYFLKEKEQSVFTTKAWIVIGGAASLLFLLNVFVMLFSMSLSRKKLEELEG